MPRKPDATEKTVKSVGKKPGKHPNDRLGEVRGGRLVSGGIWPSQCSEGKVIEQRQAQSPKLD